MSSSLHQYQHHLIDDDEEDISVIVVARHGERLDYYIRDHPNEIDFYNIPVSNWCSIAKHPFDPPLTSRGMEQAQVLGSHLVQVLQELHLPNISEIYTSPLLRCRQTAINVRHGIIHQQQENVSTDSVTTNQTTTTTTKTTTTMTLPVRVDMGLMESMTEDWYRAWALPGSDGTWGYHDNGQVYDKETIHEMAKVPIQNIFTIFHDEYTTDVDIDTSYISKTSINDEYSMYHEHYETHQQQQDRMKEVVDVVTASVGDTGRSFNITKKSSTIVLISHGGPMVQLYESITHDEHAHMNHGETMYCSYSIYIKKNNNSSINRNDVTYNISETTTRTTNDNQWKALRINQSKHIREMGTK